MMRIRYMAVASAVLLVAAIGMLAKGYFVSAAILLTTGWALMALTMFRIADARLALLSQQVEAVRGYALDLFELKAEEAASRLLAQPRYQEPKRLNVHEFRTYSQGGEDGILAEIFKRVGVTNRRFVEFGVGNGFENNTAFLLSSGWSGLWIDGDAGNMQTIRSHFAAFIQSRRLTAIQAFITAENIESLFQQGETPPEFDLLSIDVDGNDFHIWNKIEKYRPRVVVAEYNGIFPPPVDAVMPYDPKHWWDGSSHYGASLSALNRLAREKGYLLVGCNLGGLNAFFVRQELAGDNFCEPFTAEHHYEPPRYYLMHRGIGHPRKPFR